MARSWDAKIFSAVFRFWWMVVILTARVNTASTEEHPAVLYTNEKEVHKLDLVTKADTLIATNLSYPYAVDYDYAKGLVAWSDITDDCIYSAPLRSGGPITVLMDGNINSLGIAIDWIHDNIYWMDYSKKTIEVAQMNGKSRKTLFDNDIHHLYSIVLNPVEGWMFWLDYGGNVPRIERAGMDGTRRSVIVADGVKRSYGLALDLGTRKLYWINYSYDIIYSVNYDGWNQHIILKESAKLYHGRQINVFQDTVYWCNSSNIYKANKYSGVNASELLVGKVWLGLRGMRVYDRSKQLQGPNRCFPANGGCSHLCLPAPWLSGESPDRTCACPDGIILSRDGATCTNDDPEPNHCFPANGGCSHLCIPAPWKSEEPTNRTCACPIGMILSPDGTTCSIKDPEPSQCFPANGGCSHLCIPAPWKSEEPTNRTCACPVGMILSPDGATCSIEDTESNQCLHANGGCSHLCIPAPWKSETPFNRTCACPIVMIISPDGATCSIEDTSRIVTYCDHGTPYVLVLGILFGMTLLALIGFYVFYRQRSRRIESRKSGEVELTVIGQKAEGNDYEVVESSPCNP